MVDSAPQLGDGRSRRPVVPHESVMRGRLPSRSGPMRLGAWPDRRCPIPEPAAQVIRWSDSPSAAAHSSGVRSAPRPFRRHRGTHRHDQPGHRPKLLRGAADRRCRRSCRDPYRAAGRGGGAMRRNAMQAGRKALSRQIKTKSAIIGSDPTPPEQREKAGASPRREFA